MHGFGSFVRVISPLAVHKAFTLPMEIFYDLFAVFTCFDEDSIGV